MVLTGHTLEALKFRTRSSILRIVLISLNLLGPKVHTEDPERSDLRSLSNFLLVKCSACIVSILGVSEQTVYPVGSVVEWERVL